MPKTLEKAKPDKAAKSKAKAPKPLDAAGVTAFFSRLDQYTLEDVLRPPTGASLITLRERAG